MFGEYTPADVADDNRNRGAAIELNAYPEALEAQQKGEFRYDPRVGAKVYAETRRRLDEIRAAGAGADGDGDQRTPIVITSFRRAGQNKTHQLLRQAEAMLRVAAGSCFSQMYFHCQSRYDNSLFHRDSSEATSVQGRV